MRKFISKISESRIGVEIRQVRLFYRTRPEAFYLAAPIYILLLRWIKDSFPHYYAGAVAPSILAAFIIGGAIVSFRQERGSLSRLFIPLLLPLYYYLFHSLFIKGMIDRPMVRWYLFFGALPLLFYSLKKRRLYKAAARFAVLVFFFVPVGTTNPHLIENFPAFIFGIIAMRRNSKIGPPGDPHIMVMMLYYLSFSIVASN